MNVSNSTSILASFATLKTLKDANRYRSVYQVLLEFISYIIASYNLYSFAANEMKGKLNAVFGFDIPEAVVKSACRNASFLSQVQNHFNVDRTNWHESTSFNEKKNTAERVYSGIIDRLMAYTNSKFPDKSISKDALVRALISFLLDEQSNNNVLLYSLVSEFVLKQEDDKKLQDELDAIREGSLLYLGINYNLNETGSISAPLTLFLNTEVLFSLVGFNGEIFEKLTEDMISLVAQANKKTKRIQLLYFSDTKQEMDNFFAAAESIVDGQGMSFDSPAMKTIVNGCKTSSDVRIKKADFYHKLQYKYGILEDTYNGYYSEENIEFNLEGIDVEDEQEQQSWKYISNVNKRRKGQICRGILNAGFLIVTNSGCTLRASRAQLDYDKAKSDSDSTADYAISVDRMTSILWLKMGQGFGNADYPSSISSLIKARTILAANISQNVFRVYSEAKEQYQKGELTDEQLAFRLKALKEKPIMPEDLKADSLDEILDFSEEYISRYEEKARQNEHELEEKDKAFRQFKEETEKEISGKNAVIAGINEQLSEKIAENTELKEQLSAFQEQENKKLKKKQKRKRNRKIAVAVCWRALVVFLIVAAFYCVAKWIYPDLSLIIGILGGVIGILTFTISGVKKLKSKHSNKRND